MLDHFLAAGTELEEVAAGLREAHLVVVWVALVCVVVGLSVVLPVADGTDLVPVEALQRFIAAARAEIDDGWVG